MSTTATETSGQGIGIKDRPLSYWLDPGAHLADETEKVCEGVEAISTWKSWSVYPRIGCAVAQKARLQAEARNLYNQLHNQVGLAASSGVQDGAASVLTEGIALQASSTVGRSVLSFLRLQDSLQGLSAVIERKYAYAFGFISLYAALVSIVLGAAGVWLSWK